jgi:hypothetical protein
MGCGYVRILFALEKQGVGRRRAVAGSLLLGGRQRGRLLASFMLETLGTKGVEAETEDEHSAEERNNCYRRHG